MVNVSLRNAGLAKHHEDIVVIIPAIQRRLRESAKVVPIGTAVNPRTRLAPPRPMTRA
jgi:hypothetical protein